MVRRKWRWRRDLNPCTRLCRPLPRLSATPPESGRGAAFRADDGIRTRDPHLGKVMRYQLRYVRTIFRSSRNHIRRSITSANQGTNRAMSARGPDMMSRCRSLRSRASGGYGRRTCRRSPPTLLPLIPVDAGRLRSRTKGRPSSPGSGPGRWKHPPMRLAGGQGRRRPTGARPWTRRPTWPLLRRHERR